MRWPWSRKKKSSPKPVKPVEPQKGANGKYIGEWSKLDLGNQHNGPSPYLVFYHNGNELLKVPYIDDKDKYINGEYSYYVRGYPDIPAEVFTSPKEKEEIQKLKDEDNNRVEAAYKLANSKFEEIKTIINSVDDEKPRKSRNAYHHNNTSARSQLIGMLCNGRWGGGSKTRRSKKHAKRRTMYRNRDTR